MPDALQATTSKEPEACTGDERTAISDATLIARSWSTPSLFGELFRRHAPQLHRYVARRLGASLADDVVAETFYRAFRARRRYDASLPDARPWLWAIASNLVRRQRRSEVRMLRALARSGVDPVLEALGDRVADQISAQAARRQLAGVLAGLSARDRDVLLLVAWGDLSYEEVAGVLQIPVGTVRSRLNRSRRKMRTALGGVDPSGDQEVSDRG